MTAGPAPAAVIAEEIVVKDPCDAEASTIKLDMPKRLSAFALTIIFPYANVHIPSTAGTAHQTAPVDL